jgi:hypothetical protein
LSAEEQSKGKNMLDERRGSGKLEHSSALNKFVNPALKN